MVEDVVIIGAGPAGLAAAIQLQRYGLHPVVFEGGRVGGLLWNANLVENYPGFPNGIPGPALVQRFARQAARLKVEIILEAVSELDWREGCFCVQTASGQRRFRCALVATGTRAQRFSDIQIAPGLGERILYEVAPLLGCAGQQIAIVGAGDAAFDYALNLSKKNQAIILNRGEQIKCLPLLWERAGNSANIQYNSSTRVLQVDGLPDGRLRLSCERRGEPLTLEVDHLVGALGRQAQTDCLAAALLENSRALEERGALYFIGDVKNGLFRQTAIAAGDGLLAAMRAYQFLKE